MGAHPGLLGGAPGLSDAGARLQRGAYRPPVNLTQVAFDWGARGFDCGRLRDPPGQAWEDFVHRHDELLLVVRGRLELEVAGETHLLEPGDEALIPAGARHAVRNRAKGETLWLYGYRR